MSKENREKDAKERFIWSIDRQTIQENVQREKGKAEG